MTDRPDIPLGYTRDAQGRVLTFRDSAGYWREHTYDGQGNELTFRDSDGFWYEHTRDGQGRELTFRNSAGFNGVRIADGGTYALLHDAKQGLFIAGCRRFNRADALKHWSREDARAKLFTAAILELP